MAITPDPVAESAVQRVIALYAQHYDDGDVASLVDLFADDALVVIGGREISGRRALLEHFSQPPPLGVRGKHMSSNVVVDVDGDRASAIADWAFLVPRDKGVAMVAAGRYRDEFARTGGTWRFTRRDITMLGTST